MQNTTFNSAFVQMPYLTSATETHEHDRLSCQRSFAKTSVSREDLGCVIPGIYTEQWLANRGLCPRDGMS